MGYCDRDQGMTQNIHYRENERWIAAEKPFPDGTEAEKESVFVCTADFPMSYSHAVSAPYRHFCKNRRANHFHSGQTSVCTYSMHTARRERWEAWTWPQLQQIDKEHFQKLKKARDRWLGLAYIIVKASLTVGEFGCVIEKDPRFPNSGDGWRGREGLSKFWGSPSAFEWCTAPAAALTHVSKGHNAATLILYPTPNLKVCRK